MYSKLRIRRCDVRGNRKDLGVFSSRESRHRYIASVSFEPDVTEAMKWKQSECVWCNMFHSLIRFSVNNQLFNLVLLFRSYHTFQTSVFTANTCVWAPKADLRWRLQAFQHHNPAQVVWWYFCCPVGSWERTVCRRCLMLPFTFLESYAVFLAVFTVKDWSTFYNKLPTNSHFFANISFLVYVQ